MSSPETAHAPAAAPKPRSSLSAKYSKFTGIILSWVAMLFIAWDAHRGQFHLTQAGLLAVVVPVMAYAISRFTHHLMAAPLLRLQDGIRAVQNGSLEPIQVSRTGDEIEYLGHQLNEMIGRLSASQAEVLEHQQMLEERIRQRTEALEEATQRAMSANRAKSEFLANISHELRTPMNGILGMLDIVLDEELPASHREHLEISKSCANTLLALLNDLLDLSKIEAGKMILERIAFDVRLLSEDCVRAANSQAAEKNIDLRFFADPAVPARIIGDPLRLRQILTNLLSNAVKFTVHGRVDVVLAIRDGENGRPWLSLTVRDTGLGIPPGKLNDIFEDFTQADGTVSRKYGGTGLGLAITRRLVHMHRGTIQVRSRVGEGSTFLVELPVELAQAERAVAPSPGAPAEAVGKPAGALVVVVEDDPVNQRVVVSALTRHGYRVELCCNGREALSALNREIPRVILMDLQMPEIDGLTATRLIRENPLWRKIPIVALTAYAMPGDRERCLQAGMDDYLSKPVAPAAVVDCVRRHLGEPTPQPAASAPSGLVSADAGRAHAPELVLDAATQDSRLIERQREQRQIESLRLDAELRAEAAASPEVRT